MPKARVMLGGQWVDLGVTSTEVDGKISNLEAKINNADQYITGSYKDGVINVVEAKKIVGYLKALDLSKADYDKRYTEIYNNAKLSSTTKTNLANQKTTTDNDYNSLVSLINSIDAVGKATATDKTNVDNAFATFRADLATLTTLLEQANKEITGGLDTRLTTAESNITQNASDIQLRVKQTDYNAGIAGANAYADQASRRQDLIKVRYIRDWLNGSTIDGNNNWVEIQAWSGGVNLASGKTVTASSTPTVGTLSLVTDGVTTSSSYVQLAGANQWVSVDLGQIYDNVEYLKVWHYYSDSRTFHGTKTEVSTDGTNWTPLFDSTKSGEYTESSNGYLVPVNINRGLDGALNRISTAESNITVNANNIALKVNQTDYNGNTIASLINQTATTIQLQASKINLNGAVNFSSFDSATANRVDNTAVTYSQLIQNSIFLPSPTNSAICDRWSFWNTAWLIDSTTTFEGVNSAKLFDSTQVADNERGIYSNFITTVPGKNYTLSVYAMSPDITKFDSSVIAELRFADSNNNPVSPVSVDIRPTANNVWQRFTITGTVPTGAVKLRAKISMMRNGQINVAKPMLQEGLVATAHQDMLLNHPWVTSGSTQIDGANIKTGTISFDQAYGGKIKLGGANYGNGTLELRDSNGDVQVTLSATQRGFDSITCGKINSPYVVKRDLGLPSMYYVDPVAGSDTNDGLTPTTQFKTIQHAIDILPKFLDSNVTIQIKAGSGLVTENLSLMGFMGGGFLQLDFVGFGTQLNGYIWIQSCTTQVYISNMRIYYPVMNPPSSSYYGVVTNFYSNYVFLYNCQIYGRNKATTGFRTYGGGCSRLQYVDIFDVTTYCISAEFSSTLSAENTGSPSKAGVNAFYALESNIFATGNVPYGAYVYGGGGNVWTPSSPAPTQYAGGTYAPPPGQTGTTTTTQWTSTGGDTWRYDYGYWRADNLVRQSEWGGTAGPYAGYWFFGTAPSTAVTSSTIQNMRIYLQRQNSGGYSSTTNAILRNSYLTTDPGSGGAQPTYGSNTVSAGFAWGEGKWVTLPSSFYTEWQNGTAKGICIYTTSTADADYMIFSPNATLEITYAK